MKIRAIIALFVIVAMVAPPGVVGVVVAVSSGGHATAPDDKLEQTRLQMTRIMQALRAVHERTGMYPKSLDAIEVAGVDPWTSPFWYCASIDDGVRLRSSGPDQKPGTADDVIVVGGPARMGVALTCEQPQGPRPIAQGASQSRWGPVHKALLRGTRALRRLFL